MPLSARFHRVEKGAKMGFFGTIKVIFGASCLIVGLVLMLMRRNR